MAPTDNDDPFADDDGTRRSLEVLADATAEIVGRGDVYKAIVAVTEDATERSFQDAREKFDHMDRGDRVRIRAQAFETLSDGEPAEPEGEVELDWAKEMMGNFPKISRDGDSGS
jgi:hypothetical protein